MAELVVPETAPPRAFRAASAMLPALLLLALALAGCGGAPSGGNDAGGGNGAGGNGGNGGGADGPGANPALDGWPMPGWRIGKAWVYSVNGQARATYGVTSETASDWIVDTDSDERAFHDARDDVSRLGPQRKSDLAGSQGDERVEFFRWPLTANKTWSGRWDHQDVALRVLAVDANGADLEARDRNGTLVYLYRYDAKSGWFGAITHYNPDGSELVSLRLEDAMEGWVGPAVRYAVAPLHRASGTDTTKADAVTLATDAAATDVWISYSLACTGTGGFTISLQPADPALVGNPMGTGHTVSGPCSGTVATEAVAPGPLGATWTLTYEWGAQSVDWSIEVLQRTRTGVAVGAA